MYFVQTLIELAFQDQLVARWALFLTVLIFALHHSELTLVMGSLDENYVIRMRAEVKL